MPSFLLSLVRRYGRDPGLVARHIGRIGGLVLRGRAAEIASGLRDMPPPAEEKHHMVRFAEAERAHAAAVQDWLRARLVDLRDLPEPIGNDLHDVKEILRVAYRRYALFDADYYAETWMADLPEGHGLAPFDHFLVHGRYGGASPNAFFDYPGYLAASPDVLETGRDPALHYVLTGWSEGRDPGPDFHPDAYLRANPDVAASGMCPLHHFLSSGRAEGRDPRPVIRPAAPRPAPGDQGRATAPGTMVLVSHDADVGGAQKVVQSLARWIRDHTRYEVRLVVMKGGGLLHEFQDIAPTFDIAEHDPGDPEGLAGALAAFCGENVRAVFLNSVASGGFLAYWHAPTPILSYIHELPKILGAHPDALFLIRERATTVIGGSEAVRQALRETFYIAPERLAMEPGFIEAGTEIETDAQKARAKQALGLDPETLLVSACGVLHWRKSPRLFIEVAEKVLARTDRPVRFLWIGGGPDQQSCEEMIAERGLKDHVRITGYEPDVQRFIDASDVFLLPSEEDPFPLVCLMAAQARNPIVCFRDAGGMPELVDRGCGAAVAFLDTEAMAAATLTYLDDPVLRASHAETGQRLVRENYTVTRAGPRLFDMIRAAAGLAPAVSVVVPNYNCAPYLKQRLESIFAQSFQDFEVLLLDDASQDDSVAILRSWADSRPATRLLINETNSGSPFAQWIRGMEQARSDLVWIAEADDFCDPGLLDTLLPAFDDRNVMLGHVRSVPVDAAGAVQGDYAHPYLDRIAPGRWSEPHTVTDHEEANQGLGIANCIPNASAVILRKFTPEPEFRDTVTGMRMCGDWLFYLRAMRGGLVAYRTGACNYHRRHDGTVTARTEGSPRYFDECAQVRGHVRAQYRLGSAALDRIAAFTRQDLDRFAVTDPDRRARILEEASRHCEARAIPSVMFVAPDFSPGGGQMFVIRLANAWVARGGRAVLVDAGYAPIHDKVLSRIDPRVVLIRAEDPLRRDLATLVARFDIELIHSTIWWADKLVADQIDRLGDIPWITSMHGCHETHLAHPGLDAHFPALMARLLERIDVWVHTADKNLAVFDTYATPADHRRIGNGVPIEVTREMSRAALGLREEAVVLCLASRAIESKGWFAAVEITQALNAEGHAVDLMLIGEGPARDAIADAAPAHVHLYGHIDRLHDYIAACDIGILPSFFVGESMPLVLLEMIGLAKPVVATDVGEIPDMIGTGTEAAGLLIPLRDGRVDIAAFGAALRGLVLSPQRRHALGRSARLRFEAHYQEEKMMRTYAELYKEVIARKAAAAAPTATKRVL